MGMRHLVRTTSAGRKALAGAAVLAAGFATQAAAKDWPAQCALKDMPPVTGPVKGVGAPPASLVQAAVAEGKLVIYSAVSETDTMDALVAEFRKVYPGVAVTWTTVGGGSQRQTAFMAEAENGPKADIVTDYSEPFLRGAFDKGYLVSLDTIIPGFSDMWPKDLVWTFKAGVTGVYTYSGFGFAYNTDLVPRGLGPNHGKTSRTCVSRVTFRSRT